uniref:Sequestosome-1 n=1 Tax=Lygus hesperus TaxID=30085 RepID=A0A0K8S8L8_LYGHE
MTMMDDAQFKVILNRPNQPAEIRRFTVDKDVVTNYGYLRQKLYAIFPVLQSTGMTISWKDSEDDLVMIGSDEELIIALTEMEGNCKKLFVNGVTPGVSFAAQGPAAAGTRPENHPKVTHDGVTCDGCDSGVISGYRYKCMVCPDFDLCFDCEQRGFHPEHVMIRYPFPVAKTRDYHFVKKLKKLHKKFDHHHISEPDFLGHDHRKSFKGHRGDRCPAFSEDVTELVEDFVTSLRTQVVQVTPDIIQQVVDSLSNLNMSGLDGSDPTAAPGTSSSNRKQGESSKKRDKDVPGKKRGCPFVERRSEMSAAMSAAHPPLANLISNVMQQVGSVAPHVMPNILSALNQMGAAVNANTPSTAATAASSAATKDGTTTDQGTPSAPTTEPMVINLDEESQPPTVTPTPPQPEVLSSPTVQKPVDGASTNTEPLSQFHQMIDRQLQNMLNMGFNNEGGWLRDMLISNGGDITKVLDHLGGASKEGSTLSRLELD